MECRRPIAAAGGAAAAAQQAEPDLARRQGPTRPAGEACARLLATAGILVFF